jgi:hypothetical protein
VAIGSAQAPVTWTGEWRTDYGKMTLSHSGGSVEGNYEHDQGHLTGSVSGSTFSGTWDEAPTRAGPYDRGYFEFTLTADPKTFDGRWRNLDDVDWRGGWDGTCTAGDCLANGETTPAPSPPGFDQAHSFPAARPGRAKSITSPVIPGRAAVLGMQLAFTGPLGQAVPSVTPVAAVNQPPGLTRKQLQDLLDRRAFARAFEICYVFGDYEPDVIEDLESGTAGRVVGSQGAFILTREHEAFERCVEVLYRLLRPRVPPEPQPGARSTGAQAAGAGCGVRALPLVLRKERGSGRVTLGVGSRGQARPRLKVECANTADGALTVTVRPRKRSARLRDVVGRRLRLGVGRPRAGPPARAGDRLNVTWSLPGS